MASHRRKANLRIIRADDWLLAVDKPAGVLSVPGRGGVPTVVELLHAARVVDATEKLLIVHRLDRGASGLMVLARTTEAQRRLTAIWSERRVQKVYLALVRGAVESDGTIELPLLVDRDRRRVVASTRHGRPAVTNYRVVERFNGFSLLECRPLTGRLHQIRVHLASAGHPLAVDPTYGGCQALLLSSLKSGYRPNRRRQESPLIDRLTLHAWRLAFDHPNGTGRIEIEAACPKDLAATLHQLRIISQPREIH